jgi:hypothetical protein
MTSFQPTPEQNTTSRNGGMTGSPRKCLGHFHVLIPESELDAAVLLWRYRHGGDAHA